MTYFRLLVLLALMMLTTWYLGLTQVHAREVARRLELEGPLLLSMQYARVELSEGPHGRQPPQLVAARW